MGNYEHLSHTADAGFRATGSDLADLFETSAVAMFEIEYELSSVSATDEQMVSVEAQDLVALMEMWLSELLFLHDAHGLLPTRFHVTKLVREQDRYLLEAKIETGQVGERFEQSGPQIKAVTLHGMEIVSDGDTHSAVVYLDV